MTSLETSLSVFIPQLHDALRKTARRALPLRLSHVAYALPTVKHSLAHHQPQATSPRSTKWNVSALVERVEADEEVARAKNDDNKEGRFFGGSPLIPVNLPLFCSKVGGFGYLPRGVAYPRNTKTNLPLQLLIQLNMSDLYEVSPWPTKEDSKKSSDDVGGAVPGWPTRGVLAVYIDPFDDLYGCNFEVRAPQVGYRVLFFEEEYERDVVPLLGRMAEDGSELVEAKLAEVMWSREEQYRIFEDLHEERRKEQQAATKEGEKAPRDVVVDAFTIGRSPDAAQLTEAEWAEEVEARRRALWGVELTDRGIYSGKRSSLWYGAVVQQEFALLPARRETCWMAPSLGCVEFIQQVLHRTFKAHPELREKVYCEYEGLGTHLRPYQLCALEHYVGEGLDPDQVEERLMDDLADGCESNYLGGYPNFTQDDLRYRAFTEEEGGFMSSPEETQPPRTQGEEVPRDEDGGVVADICLLQISEGSDRLMFGDAGVANIFIPEADLAARNFNRAYFNWDCS